MVVFVIPALAIIIAVAIIGLLLAGLVIAIVPTVGLVIAGIALFLITLHPAIPDFILFKSKTGMLSLKTIMLGTAVILFLLPFVGSFFSITPQQISDNTVGLLSIAQKSISGETIPKSVQIDPFIFFIGLGTSLVGSVLGQGILIFARRR